MARDLDVTDRFESIGSVWRRWDLHLHAPGTKLSDHYGGDTDGVLAEYLEKLEDSDVQVFGITDYFSFDSYFAVRDRYKGDFPEGTTVFLPNIEFRLTETISTPGTNVHSHVLFDPACKDRDLQTFLHSLETYLTRGAATRRCSDLTTTADFESATVSIAEIKKSCAVFFQMKPLTSSLRRRTMTACEALHQNRPGAFRSPTSWTKPATPSSEVPEMWRISATKSAMMMAARR